MTLIAGSKCQDGYVICADSQETVGSFRVSRLKLAPWKAGNFEIAMAGSGNNGELIDAFEERLKSALSGNQIETLDALKELIHVELLDFQKNEASTYPKRERQMRYIIGATSISTSTCNVWTTRSSRLIEIDKYDLIGFEDERYKFAADGFLRASKGITIAQGIFLGLYVMWLAEQTSNYVKAPVAVVVVKNGGIFSEKPAKINSLLERVKLFGAQFDGLFLTCPDTGLQHGEFARRVEEFVKTLIQLRKEYVEEWVGQAVEEGLDKVIEMFPLVPTGTQIIINPTPSQTQSHKRIQQDLSASLRQNFDYTQDPDRIVSNLESLKDRLQKTFAQQTQSGEGPTEEEAKSAAVAEGELFQAALMGPFKVGQDVCNLLHRVREFMLLDLQFGEPVNLQLRMMAVEQVLHYVKYGPRPLDSQTSGGPQ
ncbi:MAG: hypothetical protein ABR912_16720 [Terracidiphilus sp.]